MKKEMHRGARMLGMILVLVTAGFGYYEADNFQVADYVKWRTNCYYSRDGFVLPNANSTSVFTNGSGSLRFSGRPNNVGITYNGYWKGRTVYNTNLYSASAVRPFGFEIIRTNALVSQGTTGDTRYQAEVGVWLFIWKSGVTGNVAWEAHDYFADFFDFNGDFGTPNHLAQMGAYMGTARLFDMTNTKRPLGASTNLSNIVLWDYGNGGTVRNSNTIGFRIVHDGNNISFYANPDPFDLKAAYPNEWCQLASYPVTWNSNMQVMFGHAVRRGDIANMIGDADFKNYLVRNATAGSGYFLVPDGAPTRGGVRQIALVLSNRLEPFPANAGVNYVRFVRPAACDFDLSQLREMKVLSHAGDPLHESENATVLSDGRAFPREGEVAIVTNFLPDEIRLLFGRQLASRSPKGYENIRIQLGMRARNDHYFDQEPGVYVMAEQFEGMTSEQKNRYSTCGWEKSSFQGIMSEIPMTTVR